MGLVVETVVLMECGVKRGGIQAGTAERGREHVLSIGIIMLKGSGVGGCRVGLKKWEVQCLGHRVEGDRGRWVSQTTELCMPHDGMWISSCRWPWQDGYFGKIILPMGWRAHECRSGEGHDQGHFRAFSCSHFLSIFITFQNEGGPRPTSILQMGKGRPR